MSREHPLIPAFEEELQAMLRARSEAVRPRGDPMTEIALRGSLRLRRRRTFTTAAAAVAAGAAVAAVIFGGNVVVNDQGGDRGLPAKQHEPDVPLLLIADELPTRALAPIVVTKAGHAGREPIAPCQQAPIDSLGPRKIWHRTVSTRPAGHEAWTQVVAEFASAQAAHKAFATVARWFSDCSGSEESPRRWPEIQAAAGRSMFVEILRELPPDQIVTRKGAEAWNVAHEHIAYGISGAKITIIAMSQFGPRSYFSQQQFDYLARFGNRLETTARFALERLAGTRTVTGNAVPPGFRFAQKDPDAVGRDTSLATEWAVSCQRARRLDHDVLRTGMLTSLMEDGHGTGTRQVAVYPDVSTARAAAEELRAALTGCDGLTPDRSMDADGVYVLTAEPGDWTTVAAAVAQWGTAVFLSVEDGHHTEGPTKAEALSYTREAVRANRPLVCEVVPKCA